MEIFVPRSSTGVDELLQRRLGEYAKRGPMFISVDGSPSGEALRIVEHIRSKYSIRPQLHIPRPWSTEAGISKMLDDAIKSGVRDILLLGGEPGFVQGKIGSPDFLSTTDIVKFIKARYGNMLRIAVCGFPRGTSGEKGDYKSDLKELQQQVLAGAETIICLPVFEVEPFLAFVADASQLGIRCPVLPGILPLRDAMEFHRICRALHLTPPMSLVKKLGDSEAVQKIGEVLFRSLVKELHQCGHRSLHIYTLNADSSMTLMDSVGYTPLKHRAGSR